MHSAPIAQSNPAGRHAVEGLARPRWFWFPVTFLGGLLFFAGGGAMLVIAIRGGWPLQASFTDIVVEVFSLFLGLLALAHVPETLAVYQWNAAGLTKTTPFRRTTIRWDDLADASSIAPVLFLELRRSILTSRTGTKLSVPLYLLPKRSGLQGILWAWLQPIWRRKVEEAFHRPKTVFQNRLAGIPVTRIVFDGARLHHGSDTITLGAVTLVKRIVVGVNHVAKGGRIELTAPNTKTFWFLSNLSDIDVLYGIIRRCAPQAAWLGFEGTVPIPRTPTQRREELRQWHKWATFRIWQLWFYMLVFPAVFFLADGRDLIRGLAGVKGPGYFFDLALAALLAVYILLMLWAIRRAYRERARLRRERTDVPPPLTR